MAFSRSFSSNAFRRYSLTETIAVLAQIGYQGIEIMADRPHAYPPDLSDAQLAEIRRCLADHRLQVANINAFMLHAEGDTWHPSWIETDPRQRQRRIDHTRRCIDLAAAVGSPTISTEPGGPLGGVLPDTAKQWFREGLVAIEDHARQAGVRVLIEPEPGLLIENSRQFADFYKDLDQEVFGLNFDIGHFYCVGEDPAATVRRLASFTGHYHLEDIASDRVHHHLLPGTGAIDLYGVLQAITEEKYDGFVTVELYPYEDDPVETAHRAFAYLVDWSEHVGRG